MAMVFLPQRKLWAHELWSPADCSLFHTLVFDCEAEINDFGGHLRAIEVNLDVFQLYVSV